jgi:hypothetical protein
LFVRERHRTEEVGDERVLPRNSGRDSSERDRLLAVRYRWVIEGGWGDGCRRL